MKNKKIIILNAVFALGQVSGLVYASEEKPIVRDGSLIFKSEAMVQIRDKRVEPSGSVSVLSMGQNPDRAKEIVQYTRDEKMGLINEHDKLGPMKRATSETQGDPKPLSY